MPTYSLATLEQRSWDQLEGNSTFYTEPNIRGALNEGLCRLNVHTGFTQATVTIPGNSVVGRLRYTVPSGVMFPMRVYFAGRELQKLSLRGLGEQYRNWMTDAGPVRHWAPIGSDQFVIHPADSVGGNTIQVFGVGPVTQLVNQGDPVLLNDEYVDILVEYGGFRPVLREGGGVFARASLRYRRYIEKVKAMSIWESMSWPQYWLLKQNEPAEGKGA